MALVWSFFLFNYEESLLVVLFDLFGGTFGAVKAIGEHLDLLSDVCILLVQQFPECADEVEEVGWSDGSARNVRERRRGFDNLFLGDSHVRRNAQEHVLRNKR